MLEASSIIARLKDQVTAFGSIEGAAELAALMAAPPPVSYTHLDVYKRQLVNGGESNKWAGTAEVLLCPWI